MDQCCSISEWPDQTKLLQLKDAGLAERCNEIGHDQLTVNQDTKIDTVVKNELI